MTSMRKFAVVGSVSELLPLQPASSAPERMPAVPET
jgi:hypothetical protein